MTIEWCINSMVFNEQHMLGIGEVTSFALQMEHSRAFEEENVKLRYAPLHTPVSRLCLNPSHSHFATSVAVSCQWFREGKLLNHILERYNLLSSFWNNRKELEVIRSQLDRTGVERNIAVQAAVQQQQLAAEEAERAKVAATHLLDLADQAAMVSIMYQVMVTPL
jgi:hypothetical protein